LLVADLRSLGEPEIGAEGKPVAEHEKQVNLCTIGKLKTDRDACMRLGGAEVDRRGVPSTMLR